MLSCSLVVGLIHAVYLLSPPSPQPRGSEAGVSTWNIQVSYFPGVHKPNLAMMLATSQNCKIMKKYPSEWFSGSL